MNDTRFENDPNLQHNEPGSTYYGDRSSTSSTAEDLKDQASEAAHSVRERASEIAVQAKEKVQGSGKAVRSYIDDKRQPAANALDRTASGIRDRSDRSVNAVVNATNRSAEKLEKTAEYLRSHDAEAMLDDTKTLVKRHPTQSMIVAVALGFLLGRALTHNREA